MEFHIKENISIKIPFYPDFLLKIAIIKFNAGFFNKIPL